MKPGGSSRAGSINRSIRQLGCQSDRETGYALVEVVVAATLLGVVLAVLMEGFSHGLSALSYLNERWVAITLARGLAAQPEMVGRPGQGRFEYPFDRFAWSVENGRVTVTWPEGGGKRFALPAQAVTSEVRRKGETASTREVESGLGAGSGS
jgi:hypothetical protein